MRENVTDLIYINSAKNGDQNAYEILLNKYKYLVTKISRKYFIIGGDKEDLNQEGMIGLFYAINNYDELKNDNFASFASTCIERKLINEIKKCNSFKHTPLNNSRILNNQGEITNEADDVKFVLPSKNQTPEDKLLSNENIKGLLEQIKATLSKFELSVLELYLMGLDYIDIAKEINKSNKSIDNALNRIKTKLKFLK